MTVVDVVEFYAIAAVVIGGAMAASRQVVVDINGNELPYPRLTAFFVFGLLWPWVIFKLLFGRD